MRLGRVSWGFVVAAMGWVAGCRGNGVGISSLRPDAGPVPTVEVSGSVRLYPPAAAYLAVQHQSAPSATGRMLTLEEPLGKALNDSAAELGDQALSSDGSFSFPKVPTDQMNRLVAAALHDKGSTSAVDFANVASVLYDAAVFGQAPVTDLKGLKAELVPSGFVAALEATVTTNTLQQLTDGGASTLTGAGFVVGAVTDAFGTPRAGMQLSAGDPALQAQVFYPAADFSSVNQTATSSNGLFVFVHSGAGTVPFTLQVVGDASYTSRNALATPGEGLVVKFFPGTQEP